MLSTQRKRKKKRVYKRVPSKKQRPQKTPSQLSFPPQPQPLTLKHLPRDLELDLLLYLDPLSIGRLSMCSPALYTLINTMANEECHLLPEKYLITYHREYRLETFGDMREAFLMDSVPIVDTWFVLTLPDMQTCVKNVEWAFLYEALECVVILIRHMEQVFEKDLLLQAFRETWTLTTIQCNTIEGLRLLMTEWCRIQLPTEEEIEKVLQQLLSHKNVTLLDQFIHFYRLEGNEELFITLYDYGVKENQLTCDIVEYFYTERGVPFLWEDYRQFVSDNRIDLIHLYRSHEVRFPHRVWETCQTLETMQCLYSHGVCLKGAITHFFPQPQNGIAKWLFQNTPEQVWVELREGNLDVDTLLLWFGLYGMERDMLPVVIKDWNDICYQAVIRKCHKTLHFMCEYKDLINITDVRVVGFLVDPLVDLSLKIRLHQLIKPQHIPLALKQLM